MILSSDPVYRATFERQLAHRHFFAYKAYTAKVQADYDAECAEDLADGHRPHYCIHGTNMWTDYDPICPGCESGEPLWDDSRDWDDAKRWAHDTIELHLARTEAIMELLPMMHRDPDLRAKLIDWALEPLDVPAHIRPFVGQWKQVAR